MRLPTSAGVTDSVKTTEYNALGWKTSESVWGDATKVTTFDLHDPFGRVGRVTPPGQPAVELTYAGERVKTRQVKIMMASGAQETAYTTELYDAHGRLRRVCENQSQSWAGWVRKATPVGATEVIPDPDVKDEDAVVTETFEYAGHDGRVSARQTRYRYGDETVAFDLAMTHDDLGNTATLTYPRCVAAADGCAAAAPSRTVAYQYTKGFLTSVPGYATDIDYQAGGMLHQIEHANGVVYTMALDSTNGLERPYRISTTAGWDTGTYGYDGAGNIHRIGSQLYRYDRFSRLVSGQVQVGVGLRTQTTTYDDFGNITSMTTNGSVQSTPTDPTTNRLNSPLASYDGGGNVTVLDYGSERYEYTYDGANMMKYLTSDTGLARTFVYTADDERVLQLDCETANCAVDEAKQTWTVRNVGAEVLRVYVHAPGRPWEWEKDYVHRGGQPLAAVDAAGVLHLHPDHLGTPRQITKSNGGQESLHSYYPFGQEATGTGQDDVALKFTGHERDSNDGRPMGHLDYMKARFCSPGVGRFLSIDPADTTAEVLSQGWNLYTYVLNNPIKYYDPNGEETKVVFGLQTANNFFGHVAIAVNDVVFSYGTQYVDKRGDWGVPLEAYLHAQNEQRETLVLTLNVSDDQESELLESLSSSNPNAEPYSVLSHSCVTVCEKALEAASILPNEPGAVVYSAAGDALQPGAPSSRTPSGLVGQVEKSGLIISSNKVGSEKVTKIQSLIRTIKNAMNRLGER